MSLQLDNLSAQLREVRDDVIAGIFEGSESICPTAFIVQPEDLLSPLKSAK